MTEFQRKAGNAPSSLGRAFLSRRSATLLPPLKAQLIFWPLVVIGLALDLWSKNAIFNWLEHRGGISIINGFLQLVRVENDGAAFGIATGQRCLLIAVSAVALIVVVMIFLFSGTEQKLVHIALGLFAAGICGNLYDRIFNDGLVRDFIDVVYWPGRHWPAFNIADSMLCVGVGMIIISGFWAPKHS